MTYAETAVKQTINGLLNEHPDLDASTDGALDNLDQFHISGADAVDLLIPTLALTDTDVVLDVGSGFGAPARQIARRTGDRVIGIDITAAYVDAARDLTERTSLGDLVQFEATDIAAFQPAIPFQAAITMHVQMNVQDKLSWFAHMLVVWRPALAWPSGRSANRADRNSRGRCPGRSTAQTATSSTPRPCAPRSNRPDSAPSNGHGNPAGAQAWIAKTISGGLPTGPALPMLLNDGYTRVMNYATALTNGALDVWRGCFTKNSTN
jgi:SAM-dependent methyltransferase